MAAKHLELLNAADHAALRIGPVDGPPPAFVQIVVEEFSSAAALCPIFVTRAETTGEFYAGALLGLKPTEPTLIAREELVGLFEPLDWMRRGFHAVGDKIAIDRDDPRFASAGGALLFGSDGAPAPALASMAQSLGRLQHGIDDTHAFIAAAIENKLLEPIDIALKFDDGERLNLAGLYTISLDAIGELGDAEALTLFRSGHLQAAFAMAQSVRQLGRLARIRNARLAG